jgi:tyrosyl-tRNA synthetase
LTTGYFRYPTGKNTTRPPLTREEVLKNAETYKQQVFKILDPKKTKIEFNSNWLDKLSSREIIQLASQENVARMLERDDFKKRYQEGRAISIHEFLYPLIQGYDSVALKADIELGGTDQKFNLLMGRQLQRIYNQKPQCVLMMPLLVGMDGVQKMSKSLGNYIGITEAPEQIFGKIMSITDMLMWNYYELLSAKSLDEIKKLKKDVESGKLHPKEAKIQLAKEIVARFHSSVAADQAAQDFDMKFRQQKAPDDLPALMLPSGSISVVKIIKEIAKATESSGEARRLIQQRAVKLDGEVIDDIQATILPKTGQVLQIGKKKWFRLQVSS